MSLVLHIDEKKLHLLKIGFIIGPYTNFRCLYTIFYDVVFTELHISFYYSPYLIIHTKPHQTISKKNKDTFCTFYNMAYILVIIFLNC